MNPGTKNFNFTLLTKVGIRFIHKLNTRSKNLCKDAIFSASDYFSRVTKQEEVYRVSELEIKFLVVS